MQRIYSDESTLTMTYSNLCLFLRHLGRPELTEDEVNDFIEMEIEAGNIKAKDTRLMEDSIYRMPVKSLPLSPRSFKCLVRALPDTSRPDEERTIGEVMRRIPHISGIRNCGYTTAKEIYDVFKAAGIKVDHWTDEVKLPYHKGPEPTRSVFPVSDHSSVANKPIQEKPRYHERDEDELDEFFKDTDYTTGVLYRKGKRVIIELSKERKRKK